jgi:hypothetical protein
MSQTKEILIFSLIGISNNKKGMLTETIEQKCSAAIKNIEHFSAAHTQKF